MDSLLLKELYHNQNLSQRDIARKMGMTQSSVGYWINKHGLTADDALMAKKMAIRTEKLTKHPISLTRDELERLFVTEGRQQKEIAEMCGVPRASITRAVKMFGLSLTLEQQGKRHGNSRRGKESPLKGTFANEPLMTREHLEYLYVREKLTQSQIAKLFGVTQSTIEHYIVSRGLRESRTRRKFFLPGGRPYTEKAKIKTRIKQPCLKELKALSDGGMTPQELADHYGVSRHYVVCWKRKAGITRQMDYALTGRTRIKNRGDVPVLNMYGYVTVSAPDHPYAHHNGRVPEHRLVVERFVGRMVCKKTEEIHHINRIKTDNRIENLALLTKRQHRQVHSYYEKVGLYAGGLIAKPDPFTFEYAILWGGKYVLEVDLAVDIKVDDF